MAIYHLSASMIRRSAGRSATAAAAYRAGERIEDHRTGEVHDYRRRSGVVATGILAPDHAPEWARDRTQLWSAVETAERRRDAQVAREITVALPAELGVRERGRLVAGWVRDQLVARGMVADVAIHAPDASGDARNHHAHILLTTREITPEGFGPKHRGWNDQALLAHWREAWAEHVNRALEQAGHEARVDHRSLADQGIDRLPTRHLGPAAAGMERRGVPSDRGDQARRAADQDAAWRRQLAELDAEIARQAELDRRRQAPMAGQFAAAAAGGRRPRRQHVASVAATTGAQRYRAALLAERAGAWVPDALAGQLAWVQRSGDLDRITWTDGHAMTDAGDQLTVSHGDQADAERAMALAAARGWSSASVTGDDAWIAACAACAAAHGLTLVPADDHQRQLLARLDGGRRAPQDDYLPPTPGM
ncbi:MobQ family relaxase [Salinisphaera sp. P385]|uniref:MobQ family relaxase n=1 Tax=Spectribacter acetivorans TaxID=3075603 RepID=A0ABU3BBW3_9GAMM|nr:MobQ family relaxase [Salinisphaera sp. P385]MDT0619954.1 MobQ family relaxase [Salinisphaera sp. P385]